MIQSYDESESFNYWSKDDVWDYIKRHDVPYNDLHDRGFVSIGCEPCTRAIEPGDDERAGRWWWEDATKKNVACMCLD